MDGLDGERQAKWFSDIRRHFDTYAFWRVATVGVNKGANKLFTELCATDKDKSFIADRLKSRPGGSQ